MHASADATPMQTTRRTRGKAVVAMRRLIDWAVRERGDIVFTIA
ncbi:hypothetical protein [Leucobacter japonicus]|nr:hypothetical protein [Leucobacter japonicus]